jgi:NAD(P)H-dependent flavin oxidoreductase YrpB (nitropropane dioxygenase family)
MDFLKKIKLIQGGMGVYVSNWRLAKAVATARPGIAAGTVSGTGLDLVHTRLLQLGDPGGHIRRALTAFDERFGTVLGKKICDKFYIPGGKSPKARFQPVPKQVVHAQNGSDIIPMPKIAAGSVPLVVNDEVVELLIATGFVEVWLAKEGHPGKIFINFLKKIELPLVYTMYGAMLAGVDGIVVGAGNPEGLPQVCSQLCRHEPVSSDLLVLYREAGESFSVSFDPKTVAGGNFARETLQKPAFLAIVSLENLVQTLAQSPTQAPDGFIIEHHTAGGHNAGPQGPLKVDALGQPIYTSQDEPNLEAIRLLGLPFWLAGGYGSREGLQRALDAGAAGIQVGTTFALAEESGMKAIYRLAILNEIKQGRDDAALVHTTLFSPTGFPFKVAQLNNTLSEETVYQGRPRVCDLGMLEQRGLTKADAAGVRHLFQRCPAAPVQGFVEKRGLPLNADGKRCLCNGLLACVGLGQVSERKGEVFEEPAIVTLGNHLDGVRRISHNGQTPYWAADVVNDILI